MQWLDDWLDRPMTPVDALLILGAYCLLMFLVWAMVGRGPR